MDRGQRKRLADICEKLGVALFAGAALKGILTESLTEHLAFAVIPVGLVGLAFLTLAIRLSKEV
jgi:hypothetical protein